MTDDESTDDTSAEETGTETDADTDADGGGEDEEKSFRERVEEIRQQRSEEGFGTHGSH